MNRGLGKFVIHVNEYFKVEQLFYGNAMGSVDLFNEDTE